MKRASRLNAAPLLLSLILSAPLTITLTTTSSLYATVQDTDLIFANDLLNKTIIHIEHVIGAFESFFSKDDKRTYDVHVNEMRALINQINKDIYVPAQTAHKSAPDNKLYQVAFHIISELCHGLEHMYSVLHKHRSTSNVLTVGNDLKNAKKALQARCAKLPAYIDELIALIGNQDMELKGKLLALRVKTNQLLSANGDNSLAVLELLRLRKNRK